MSYSDVSPRADARAQLNASIRTLYQDTRVPVREIARLTGVTERNIYALVRRLGCRPRGRQAVPVEKRINVRASVACRRAARRQRTLASAALAQLKRHAAERREQRKRDAAVRVLSKLTQALRELSRLDAAEVARADTHARTAAEEAARLDERRRELARRIANLTRDTNASDRPPRDHSVGQSPHEGAPARIRLVSD